MSDVEEKVDYLSVDDSINGQKYCCLSFVEPPIDRLAHKESYIFHNFMKQYGHILYIQFCKHHGLSPDNKLDIKMDELYERYSDFKSMKYKELCEQYSVEIDHETHIRAVKVRGSFPSAKVAEMHAKKLRKQDESFDVFVGQVGYWVPFNPININDVEPEYMEEAMQQLVKTHLEQETKKTEVFEKRKKEMLEKVQVDHKKEGAVQVITDPEEEKRMKRRKKNQLPPGLKAKLQQQMKGNQSDDNNGVSLEKLEDCIQLEEVKEVKVEEKDLDNHIEIVPVEKNDTE